MDTQKPPEGVHWKRFSPLALAYVGDAVYDQYVRTVLAMQYPDLNAHALHEMATKVVCAHAQAVALKVLLEDMNEEELRVFKRGRNAHSATVPKNADVVEYRMATGFEAVLGYLHLSGKQERLGQVLALARTRGWEEQGHGKDKP